MAGLAKESGDYVLAVYNIVGERIRTFPAWKALQGDPFSVAWDGENDRGEQVGNGVYVLLLRGPGGVSMTKVIVLK